MQAICIYGLPVAVNLVRVRYDIERSLAEIIMTGR
jgi:hypothetical protein